MDLDVSNHGLNEGIISEFPWRDWVKPQNHDSQSTAWNFNPGTSKLEAGVLTTQLQCPVIQRSVP